MKKPVYIGAFLDAESRAKLLAAFPPRHEVVYGDHVTLCFNPSAEKLNYWRPFVGQAVFVSVRHEFYDERGQAVWTAIGGVNSENERQHVTISTALGTKPVYSNELLKTATFPLEYEILKLRATIDTYPRTMRI